MYNMRNRKWSKTEKAEIQPFAIAQAFERVHIDLIPMVKSRDGYTFILSATDASTKFNACTPLRGKMATTVAMAIVTGLILPWGCPSILWSDQGTEFVNAVNRELTEKLKISHGLSSAYHPAANGQEERTHQTIETCLRTFIHDLHMDWVDALPYAVSAYNSAVHSSTGHTPFELMTGRVFQHVIVVDTAKLKQSPGINAMEWFCGLQKAREMAAQLEGRHRLEAALLKSKSSRNKKQMSIGDHVWVRFRGAHASGKALAQKRWTLYS